MGLVLSGRFSWMVYGDLGDMLRVTLSSRSREIWGGRKCRAFVRDFCDRFMGFPSNLLAIFFLEAFGAL